MISRGGVAYLDLGPGAHDLCRFGSSLVAREQEVALCVLHVPPQIDRVDKLHDEEPGFVGVVDVGEGLLGGPPDFVGELPSGCRGELVLLGVAGGGEGHPVAPSEGFASPGRGAQILVVLGVRQVVLHSLERVGAPENLGHITRGVSDLRVKGFHEDSTDVLHFLDAPGAGGARVVRRRSSFWALPVAVGGARPLEERQVRGEKQRIRLLSEDAVDLRDPGVQLAHFTEKLLLNA